MVLENKIRGTTIGFKQELSGQHVARLLHGAVTASAGHTVWPLPPYDPSSLYPPSLGPRVLGRHCLSLPTQNQGPGGSRGPIGPMPHPKGGQQ